MMEKATKGGSPLNIVVSNLVGSQVGLVAAGPSEGLVYNDKELDYNNTESGAWMLATRRRNRGRGRGDASFASARGSQCDRWEGMRLSPPFDHLMMRFSLMILMRDTWKALSDSIGHLAVNAHAVVGVACLIIGLTVQKALLFSRGKCPSLSLPLLTDLTVIKLL